MGIPNKLKKQWMTEGEAREELAISRVTLWRRRRNGVLTSREFNGRVLISRRSVELHLKNG